MPSAASVAASFNPPFGPRSPASPPSPPASLDLHAPPPGRPPPPAHSAVQTDPTTGVRYIGNPLPRVSPPTRFYHRLLSARLDDSTLPPVIDSKYLRIFFDGEWAQLGYVEKDLETEEARDKSERKLWAFRSCLVTRLDVCVERWTESEGSNVKIDVQALPRPGAPRSEARTLSVELDVSHLNGFCKYRFEKLKGRFRSWQADYKFEHNISDTRALTIPPPGQSFAPFGDPSPHYDPKDPQTWVPAFPPLSQAELSERARVSDAKKEAAGDDDNEQDQQEEKMKGRARQSRTKSLKKSIGRRLLAGDTGASAPECGQKRIRPDEDSDSDGVVLKKGKKRLKEPERTPAMLAPVTAPITAPITASIIAPIIVDEEAQLSPYQQLRGEHEALRASHDLLAKRLEKLEAVVKHGNEPRFKTLEQRVMEQAEENKALKKQIEASSSARNDAEVRLEKERAGAQEGTAVSPQLEALINKLVDAKLASNAVLAAVAPAPQSQKAKQVEDNSGVEQDDADTAFKNEAKERLGALKSVAGKITRDRVSINAKINQIVMQQTKASQGRELEKLDRRVAAVLAKRDAVDEEKTNALMHEFKALQAMLSSLTQPPPV